MEQNFTRETVKARNFLGFGESARRRRLYKPAANGFYCLFFPL
jgi:hypothetical protein